MIWETRHRLKNNIKMDLGQMGFEDLNWVKLYGIG
jgi:hypothetical protein